jgi:heme exporter protein D
VWELDAEASWSASAEEPTVGGDVDHPERDSAWDRGVRDETDTERLDRNWIELLQELRVVQTGVQLLTGFLLTLPFQQRFTALSDYQRGVYLVAVASSVASTILLIAPVSLHRAVFRQHARKLLVSASHRCALGGLTLLGLAVTGVVLLIFDTVLNHTAGTIAGTATFIGFLTLWGVIPRAQRTHVRIQ